MADFNVGLEIERKYIIEKPDPAHLRSMPEYSESAIIQTYLRSREAETRRVRSRETDGEIRYYETVKRRIDRMSSVERERELTREEYESALSEIKDGTRPIVKTRYTFAYLSHTVEIDVYPEWANTAILEVELPSRECPVELPGFITVLREVTGLKSYSNAGMSRGFPPEEK